MFMNSLKFGKVLVALILFFVGVLANSSSGDEAKTKQVVNGNHSSTSDDTNEDEETIKKIKENEKSLEDTLTKFKELPRPLWKIKDKLGKRQEAGFDLTRAEKIKFKIWKNGVIPYYIDVVSFSDKANRDRIRSYLQRVNSASGLNFVELPGPPANDKERWVFFMNRRRLLGCADHSVTNFTNHGVQQVVLGYDCIETRGEIAEAVMSIAGVPAQHNAPDRDDYIQVNMENIMPGKRYLFNKLKDNEWLFHDLEYDFNSITHYDIFKYSENGHPSLLSKNESVDLGLAKELSRIDLLKIRMLYNYIAKTAPLQRSHCAKLFKPRNKFERFVPHRILFSPRQKPTRYLQATGNVVNKVSEKSRVPMKLLGTKLFRGVPMTQPKIYYVNKHANQAPDKTEKVSSIVQIEQPKAAKFALTLLSDYLSY